MPKNDIDYSNTLIYMIYCLDVLIHDVYVGHTTNLTMRKTQHKSLCNNPNSTTYNLWVYQYIRMNGGWDNWKFTVLETANLKNNNEATLLEYKWFVEKHATLNSNVPSRTDKQHRIDNADKIKETNKQYRIDNADKIKEYRIDNADKIKEYQIEYRIENADKIKEYKIEYRIDNADKIKEYRIDNADKIKETNKQYRIDNADKIKETNNQYRIDNVDKIKEINKKYCSNNADKIAIKKNKNINLKS